MKTKRTLRAVAAGLALVGMWASPADAQQAKFTYGHIFVSVQAGKPCLNGEDAILEIDPVTGEWSLFADSKDGLCRTTGLRFTPDGRRLLCLNADSPGTAYGSIQSFNSQGAGEVILGRDDGLATPIGGNGLAFDAEGNLYVIENSELIILRFPASGGPPTVFADAADGIGWPGALDFAPNGDLFHIGRFAEGPIRITPQGVGSVFDTLPNGISLVLDRRGNLFVSALGPESGTVLYRYDNGDPKSRRVLASGFIGSTGHVPLALSPDESAVYVTDLTLKVYAVDVNDGATTVIADFSDAALAFEAPYDGVHGIAVYAPASIPAVSHWGVVLLTLLLASAATVVIQRRGYASTSGRQSGVFVHRMVARVVV